MTVARETIIFLLSCVLGMWTGVIYDVFRIIRIAFPTGKWILFAEDTLFVFVAMAFTFLFDVHFLNGYLRGFVIVGEILGFIIYYFTVGVVVFKCSKKLIFAIKSFIRWMYRIFLIPVWRLFKYICMKNHKIFKHISQKLFLTPFGKNFLLKRH